MLLKNKNVCIVIFFKCYIECEHLTRRCCKKDFFHCVQILKCSGHDDLMQESVNRIKAICSE